MDQLPHTNYEPNASAGSHFAISIRTMDLDISHFQSKLPKTLSGVFYRLHVFLRTQIYAGAVHLGQRAKVGS